MKTIVTALFSCALCIATGCSKSPTQAPTPEVVAAPVVAAASPADRYIGLWVDNKDPGWTVEVKRNGAGFLAKLTMGAGETPLILPVTFEPDGSMRTSRGTSATIDVETGLMLFGVSTLKRVR